jgi:hypothetical protein
MRLLGMVITDELVMLNDNSDGLIALPLPGLISTQRRTILPSLDAVQTLIKFVLESDDNFDSG